MPPAAVLCSCAAAAAKRLNRRPPLVPNAAELALPPGTVAEKVGFGAAEAMPLCCPPGPRRGTSSSEGTAQARRASASVCRTSREVNIDVDGATAGRRRQARRRARS